MNAPGISIIICCYNSALRLPETIRHIAAQQVAHSWEVIVVDNASTDNTTTIAKSEWEKHQLTCTGFNIIKQDIPGLNFARQMGVQQARYEYIIFCDDDNWLSDNYLQIAWEVMQSNKLVGATGGQCLPQTDDNTYPDWFDTYKDKYAMGQQAATSGDVTDRGYLWGAGLVSTKTILNKCFNSGYPSLLTDRLGNTLSSGGDAEMCCRIILCGYRLHYDDRLILKHFIPADRLTLNYLKKLVAGIDAAHNQLSKYYKVIQAITLNNQQKLTNSFKSFLKLLASPVNKSWSSQNEKQLLYIYSRVDLGVDDDLKLITKFKDEFAKSAS
jgi:glycosyltransferase involved in cell wall biosynthesis